jgi:hypothetical protein
MVFLAALERFMKRSHIDRVAWTNRETSVPFLFTGKSLLLFLLSLTFLSACGGRSSRPPLNGEQLAGNWQFTMSPPSDNSFVGGLQGGFLLQNNQSITGEVVYSISLPPQSNGSPPTPCNSGSTPVTGTFDGQNINLTVTAVNQTFTLSGILSASGSTMMGTYTSTAGAKGCGTAQTGLQWSATLVPPLTGAIQGMFHSVQNNPALRNQVFPVTGSLTQGENIGASNATVTGTLNFEGYPCLINASVNGQVSGNSVILQIIASNGLNVGQIGEPLGLTKPFPAPVTVLSSSAGVVLQGANGYGVTTSSCPGGIEDAGDACLGLGNANSCTQPLLLSPASLTFPAQQVGSAPTTQTITLTNNNLSGTALSGLSLALTIINPAPGLTSPFGLSDFNGLPSFKETDNCPSSLAPQQSCIITISFSPQQSCPWLPSTALQGEPPSSCPFPLMASLTVTSPVSSDSNTEFAVPITGTGFSAIVPSTPELDFGAEAVGETSAPQLLSFTNEGANPVQILPALSRPCATPATTVLTLPQELAPGVIAGLQVDASVANSGPTKTYSCDSDPTSQLPNFQISADGCSGTLLMPQVSCSLLVTFAPQPATSLVSGLDYFLELNTLQCSSSITSNCEIDSGRFPVELKAQLPSPLRMTPGAGLTFGAQPKGTTSAPLAITLFNDPNDPHAGTINLTGNLLQGSSFAETDNCRGSLAPGNSCTFTVTFTPNKMGFQSGTITIADTLGQAVGQPQTIYLRGTGQ